MELSERAAYIEGMAEALRLGAGDDRDRLLLEISHGFSAIARELEDINEELDQIALNETEGQLVAVRCLGCGEELAVDEELLSDPAVEVSCPNCGDDLSSATKSPASRQPHAHGQHG